MHLYRVFALVFCILGLPAIAQAAPDNQRSDDLRNVSQAAQTLGPQQSRMVTPEDFSIGGEAPVIQPDFSTMPNPIWSGWVYSDSLPFSSTNNNSVFQTGPYSPSSTCSHPRQVGLLCGNL